MSHVPLRHVDGVVSLSCSGVVASPTELRGIDLRLGLDCLESWLLLLASQVLPRVVLVALLLIRRLVLITSLWVVVPRLLKAIRAEQDLVLALIPIRRSVSMCILVSIVGVFKNRWFSSTNMASMF